MLKSTIKKGSGLERKTGHMLAIDKHLIPFTGADRHNDRLVISGKPKGGNIGLGDGRRFPVWRYLLLLLWRHGIQAEVVKVYGGRPVI